MRTVAGLASLLAAWLMVSAALVVALLAVRLVGGSLVSSVVPASVVVSDDCRTVSDPGDPHSWPTCGGK